MSIRTHDDRRPSKFIVLADNMRSAINMAWEHGGPDFQSRFDKSTGQTFYDTCQVPFFIFFMLPGASSVEQYWPGGSFHHKVYDLSTLQK